MANNYVDLPETGGGGASGVSSLNGLTGALTLIGGGGINITQFGTNITISSSAAGTVTSVGLAAPGVIYTVSGSPVTTSGTLTLNLISQPANTFFAAPNGSSGTPSFRVIVPADIPTLNQNTTGTASNITATSNSTLTTLSALSLPTSQLSGSISLTTQVSGTLPIASGGTNATTLANARTNLGITAGVQLITSGTTYTTPANITTSTLFKFNLVGGGAGGAFGSAAADGNAGGGGGANVVVYATGLSPSTSFTITIGSGGAGGIQSSATSATSGGNTTIILSAVTYTAGGGGIPGGNTATSSGGAGGTATNTFGTGFSITGVNIPGGFACGAGTLVTNQGWGGNSGSLWGSGGQNVRAATTNGNPGTGFGGGGSGGSGLTGNGGAGAPGMILVEFSN